MYMLDNIFKIISYSFALINTFYLKIFFKKIGTGSMIFRHSRIISPSHIMLGKNCIILPNARMEVVKKEGALLSIGDHFNAGNNLFISCATEIIIGRGVLLSDNVAVIDNSHIDSDLDNSIIDQGISSSKIIIGDNVTIYRNATILEGVTIGDGAIIAANSLVKNNVAPFSIVGGCPSKVIGSRE